MTIRSWKLVLISSALACAGACGEADSEGKQPPSPAGPQVQGRADSAESAGTFDVSSLRPTAMQPATTTTSGSPNPTTPTTPAPGAVPPGAGSAGRGGVSAVAGSGAPAPQAPPIDTSRERFPDVGTNPFVRVEHDPFSTFGADVDTASYDIFRRNLEHGVLPDRASVRVEDFVNYFAYDYPAPSADAEHPFQISLAAAPNAFGHDTVLLRVGIAAENPPPQEKKPTNLVFLIDTSGSMQSADKLPLVQSVAKHAVDMLAEDDKVSIVTYSTEALVQLQPTPVLRRDEIVRIIDGLQATGRTNGAGGIQLAYQQAQDAFIEDGINHVILCTDGDFNVGISNTDELVKFIEDKRRTGVTLTALGFGIGNLNDEMMERVSNAGNGIYSVITSEEQASRYAEERMLATLVHVAKDMKIQLEWNPAHVLAYRLIGYENRAIADQDFRDDKVDAGEIGAGHRVTALYEVVRTGGQIPAAQGAPTPVIGDAYDGEREVQTNDLVLVKVRYKEPGASESDAAREVVQRLAPSDIGALFDDADRDLQWAAAMAAFAEILKASPYATLPALDMLKSVFHEQVDRDPTRREFVELFDKAKELL